MKIQFNSKGKLYHYSHPIVMGIINLTPDSFYEKSTVQNIDTLLKKIEIMSKEGAEIIDLGGQSTRPQSQFLTWEEEWQRIAPFIEIVCKTFSSQLFSIDSFHSEVVKRALDKGVGMVNDISGGQLDKSMLATVAAYQVPYICMHTAGSPQTMQENPLPEEQIVEKLLDYFDERLYACKTAGIADCIIDIGFGFGKTTAANFSLIKNLNAFSILNAPLLVGVSRKSSIYKTLHLAPEEALNGTTVLHTIALMQGASILRVHDVKPAKEAIILVEKIKNTV